MKIGDKLKCVKTINNLLGWPLFKEGEIYDVMNIHGREITLNHILYGNEYESYDIDFINEYFTKTRYLQGN